MRFVNSLERDQTFFVITGMSLTGQQGGLVKPAARGCHLAPAGRRGGQRIALDRPSPVARLMLRAGTPGPGAAPAAAPAATAPARPAKGGE